MAKKKVRRPIGSALATVVLSWLGCLFIAFTKLGFGAHEGVAALGIKTHAVALLPWGVVGLAGAALGLEMSKGPGLEDLAP